MIVESVSAHFIERNRTMIGADKNSVTSNAVKPLHDVLRVGDASAKQKQLSTGRGEGEGQFVIQPTVRIGDHLVFVDDEKGGTIALDQAMLLSFQSGHDDGGVQIFCEVAGGDAY